MTIEIRHEINRTILDIERARKIKSLLDGLKENDLMIQRLRDELVELNVWHGDTVPDHVFYATVFREKIMPAQIAYIEVNAGMKASQLMPKLTRIAEKIVANEPRLVAVEYSESE